MTAGPHWSERIPRLVIATVAIVGAGWVCHDIATDRLEACEIGLAATKIICFLDLHAPWATYVLGIVLLALGYLVAFDKRRISLGQDGIRMIPEMKSAIAWEKVVRIWKVRYSVGKSGGHGTVIHQDEKVGVFVRFKESPGILQEKIFGVTSTFATRSNELKEIEAMGVFEGLTLLNPTFDLTWSGKRLMETASFYVPRKCRIETVDLTTRRLKRDRTGFLNDVAMIKKAD